MKQKKMKLLSVLLTAALVFQSTGMTTMAQGESVEIIQYIDFSELKPLEAEDFSELSEETDTGLTGATAEPAEEEAAAETPETAAEQPEDETTAETRETTAEQPEDETTTETSTDQLLFPGLPEGYAFSAEQLEQKDLLSEYADALAPYAEKDNTDLYVKGELVYLTDSAEDAQTAAEAFGGELDSFEYGVAVIRLSEDRTVSQAVIAAADADEMLPAAWPNYYKEFYATYNDPALKESYTNYQWYHETIGDTYAWAAGYKGQGIKVGILDTGILNSHEEFSGRLKQHLSMTGTSASNATTDANGHGTHVSGIVAANLNNGKGGSGVAPEASLYVYGIASAAGSISSDAELRAINRAIADGVDIINMSFGSGTYNGNEDTVLQKAYKAGIALFAAAGNSATNGLSYPASYDNVCSVAALQQDGKKAVFTNYNNAVDVAFPGVSIYSTYKNSASSYANMDGTSMACPVAVGTAAVILSGASQIPELANKAGTARVDALYKVMTQNAVKSSSAGTGAGTTYLPKVFGIDVESANAAPAAPTFSVSSKEPVTSEQLSLGLSCTTAGVNIYYSTDGKTPALKDGQVVNGSLYVPGKLVIGGAGKVTVKAIAVNPTSGKSSKAATATYTFTPNPTQVEITNSSLGNTLLPGGSTTLKAAASPSYAVASKFTWTVSPADKGVTINASGKVSASSTASAGTYTITATAVKSSGEAYTLDSGKPVSSNFTIVVAAASRVKSVAFNPGKTALSGKVGTTISLAEELVVTDLNDTVMTNALINWTSSNPDIASVDNGTVKLLSAGSATITAYANDGSNKSAVCKITVNPTLTSIALSGSTKLAAGKSITLTASMTPASFSNKDITWSVDRENAGVTVSNGKVTAAQNASGSYTITASDSTNPNVKASHTITIVKDAIKSLSMDKSMTLFATAGNTNAPTSKTLNVQINGGDSTAIAYTSSAPGVATVDADGVVHAVACGKAKITCQATDGSNKKAVCTVTVSVPVSRVTIVSAQDSDGYVCVGSSLKLKAEIGTSFGTPQNQKVNWSVVNGSEDKISISKSGVVKAKSLGTGVTDSTLDAYAYVKAEAADGSGASATYKVTVIRKIKSFTLRRYINNIYPIVTFDNGEQVVVSCYTTSISAPKGKNVGYQSGTSGFRITTDKATTKKSYTGSSKGWTKSDGFKVSVKVKLEPNGKTASTSFLMIRTANDYYITN